MKQADLTIVIPAYREERRIGKTLDELAVHIKTDPTIKGLAVEVLVVAADAPDDTDKVVLSKKKKFRNLTLLKPGPKVGKGRDVQYGMLKATGKIVIFMDADLATPLHHLAKFYKAAAKGDDIVIATRNLLKHHSNKLRRIISNVGNGLFRVAGGVWVEDSQCGFKMFSHAAAQICFSRLSILGWGFDMEVLAIAKANKLRIKSYRVNDWIAVEDGTFTEGIMRNSLSSLKELGHIFIARLSGVYRTK